MLRSFVFSALLLATSPLLSLECFVEYQQKATLESTTVGFTPFADSYGIILYATDDYLFVSAPNASTTGLDAEGAVYVYQKSKGQWINTQILSANGLSDHFGALSIVKNKKWLFISGIGTPIGPIDNVPANQKFSGSVQIYRLDSQTDKFIFVQSLDHTFPGLENLSFLDPVSINPPNTQEQGAGFGLSFDIDEENNILLVGAATQANIDPLLQPIINCGTVYSFKFDKGVFTLLENFTSPDGLTVNDGFGGVVRVSGDYALISNSALFSGMHLTGQTSVYLYKFKDNHWNYVHKVHGDQTNPTLLDSPLIYNGPMTFADNFGASIAFDGESALIGAPFESLGTNTLKGAAYFYKLKKFPGTDSKQLVFTQKVVSDDPNALFTGMGVGLDGKLAAVGDPFRSGPAGPGQGAALAYYYSKGIWSNEAVLYDTSGVSYELLGNGIDVYKNNIFAGTGSAVPTLYARFFWVPAQNPDAPIPVIEPGRVVIFKRYSK